jgi:tripeptide aminopeptidase
MRAGLALTVVTILAGGTLGTHAQGAHDVARQAAEPSVRAALDAARAAEPSTIDEQIRLCEIAAPPFREAARAQAYAEAFRAAGLTRVRLDKEGNVLGERPGRSPRPRVVVSAHLDTVFPEGTSVRVTRDGAVLRGPGIGDDCRGLAVLLAIARALDTGKVETEGSITFVGTVGEEGLGDLRGVKALVNDTLKGQIDHFISVDGGGNGVTNVGVGSRRYRVTYRGPGGHSFDDFGIANPIHALGRALALISELRVPADPKTTFSVGRVGGGTSVNAIATDAWMEVDLRSIDLAALATLDGRFRESVQRALDEENERWRQRGRLSMVVDKVGDRPAGRTPADSAIVQAALASAMALSVPSSLDQGSTDANVPMAAGIPAITIGGGGLNSGDHTVQESFDTTDSWRGTQRALLLVIALTR